MYVLLPNYGFSLKQKHVTNNKTDKNSIVVGTSYLPFTDDSSIVQPLAWSLNELYYSSRLYISHYKRVVTQCLWIMNTAGNKKICKLLRRLVTGFLPQGPGSYHRTIHVEFVVDKEALGQVSICVLLFQYHSTNYPY